MSKTLSTNTVTPRPISTEATPKKSLKDPVNPLLPQSTRNSISKSRTPTRGSVTQENPRKDKPPEPLIPAPQMTPEDVVLPSTPIPQGAARQRHSEHDSHTLHHEAHTIQNAWQTHKNLHCDNCGHSLDISRLLNQSEQMVNEKSAKWAEIENKRLELIQLLLDAGSLTKERMPKIENKQIGPHHAMNSQGRKSATKEHNHLHDSHEARDHHAYPHQAHHFPARPQDYGPDVHSNSQPLDKKVVVPSHLDSAH